MNSLCRCVRVLSRFQIIDKPRSGRETVHLHRPTPSHCQPQWVQYHAWPLIVGDQITIFPLLTGDVGIASPSFSLLAPPPITPPPPTPHPPLTQPPSHLQFCLVPQPAAKSNTFYSSLRFVLSARKCLAKWQMVCVCICVHVYACTVCLCARERSEVSVCVFVCVCPCVRYLPPGCPENNCPECFLRLVMACRYLPPWCAEKEMTFQHRGFPWLLKPDSAVMNGAMSLALHIQANLSFH